MIMNHVTLEVMRMGRIGIFFHKTYVIRAWSFPEAAERAFVKAQEEGLTPIRCTNVYECYC